jgi:hypothetical protein
LKAEFELLSALGPALALADYNIDLLYCLYIYDWLSVEVLGNQTPGWEAPTLRRLIDLSWVAITSFGESIVKNIFDLWI